VLESAPILSYLSPCLRAMSANRPTILWVENDLQYAQVYVHMLRDLGYKVILETTVGEAKRTLDRTRIDLALLDVMIPASEDDQDLNETHHGYTAGLALARWIKENHPDVRFVGFSARVDPETAAWFENHGHGFAEKAELGDVTDFCDFIAEKLQRETIRQDDLLPRARTRNKAGLEERLRQLELEYELAREGLAKGRTATIAVILSGLATLIIAVVPLIWRGKEFLSGTHIVIIFSVLAIAVVVYFSFVFGRTARIRAEISETRKMLDVASGKSVR